MSKIEKLVYDLVDEIAPAYGCSPYDVEYVREGGEWFLRVYIQKGGKVSIDDCEHVSRRLSDKLDELDPIQNSYYLEVSSPGIERKLKRDEHILGAIGEPVEIRLYRPLNGEKIVQGILKGFSNGQILLDQNGQEICIEKNKIALIKTLFHELKESYKNEC